MVREPDLEPRIPLWKHQVEAVNRAAEMTHFGLFMEVGTGKTATAINILRRWSAYEGRLLRTVVLGPPIVVENWVREFKAHSHFGKYVLPVSGTAKERLHRIKSFGELCFNTGLVFVTNYESLLMPPVLEALASWHPECLICDESHRLKNFQAKRTRYAIMLADVAKYRLILTGSPVLNSPMDLHQQFRILDRGETFGKNTFVFRAKYFRDRNAHMPRNKYFPDFVLRPGAVEEISEKIKPKTTVVKKAECLDLPPLVRKTIHVELGKEQKKLYDSVKKDFIAYMADKACVATLAVTKALRLQQIVSGFVTLEGDDGGERTNVSLTDNPRATALKEILQTLTPEHKVIVWAVFRENYAAIRKICQDLEIEHVEVHGAVSPYDRQTAIDRFNGEDKVRVFVGHPGSAGIGINLVVASYCVFYSRTFSLEQDIQAEARNYRGGSEIHESVTRIDLVAKDTIDELVSERLAAKVDVSERVLSDIAKDMMEGDPDDGCSDRVDSAHGL